MREPRAKAVPTVKIDNDAVRVTEWRFTPGAHTGQHRHEYDYVVVPLTTGALTIRAVTGDSTADLTAGDPYFRPAGAEHDVVNATPTDFAFIEIELKRPLS
jgi:quercetin dioxygenase-like cupin family protein